MIGTRTIVIAVSFMLMVSFGQLSMAGDKEKDKPCEADIKKLCADVEPGGGRIMKCLKEHEAEVSAQCKAHGGKMKDHKKKLHEACGDDAAKFCKDVNPGEGNLAKCLKQHEADLSPSCKSKMWHKRKE